MAVGEISNSLAPLRKLADSFARASEGRSKPAKGAVVLVRQLGDTAVPLLERKLKAGSSDDAQLAYFLLAQLGGARVVGSARGLLDAKDTADERKALCLALLAELGAELPREVALADPEGLREASVGDLVARLSEPYDVARAADLLLDQVNPIDLPGLLGEMVRVAGGGVTLLLDELLRRDDVAAELVVEIRGLRAPLPAVLPPRIRGRHSQWVGRTADGRTFVLATRAVAGEPRRAARFCIDARGVLLDVEHDAALRRGGLRELQATLRRHGIALQKIRARDAAGLVVRAAQASRAAGLRLPRAFFVARDLVGLHENDEHLGDASPGARAGGYAEAERLHEAGEHGRALRQAERLVLARPHDADCRALLASCLIALDRCAEAVPHLVAATQLDPDEPVHAWNLGHAAKQAGKMGACYLALKRYLATGDPREGFAQRAAVAHQFVALFERYARLEHPEASVDNVARVEELFDRAHAHLTAERHADAASGFQAVLKLVPSHYQSWSNLGVALLAERRTDEASECLRRALELRPDYEVARRNLELMER